MTVQHADPLGVVAALAPVDQPPSAEDLEAGLAQLWRDIDELPRPSFRARHPRVLAVGVAAAVAVAGVGSAAAAGVPVPHAVQRSWAFLVSDPSGEDLSYPLVDPGTGRRVFSVAGPHGTRFEGWTATNSHGGFCVTTVFTAAATSTTPTDLLDGGGQCADADAPHGTFAEGTGSSLGPSEDRVHFVWESGDAARAELQVSTGRSYPIDIQGGWLGGWYDADQVPLGASAVIVTYAADGSVLARRTAQDQDGCPNPTPC